MKTLSKNAQLLAHILTRVGGMGVTRLLKLVYVADLESRRLRGRPVSTLRFYFHRHGPFDSAFYSALEELTCEGLVKESGVWHPDGSRERSLALQAEVPLALDAVDVHILNGVCDTYGRMPLSDLLARVYESPPMRGLERGNTLPMDIVDNRDRKEIGFDIEALIAAQQEAESGNYVTGADFFDGLRAKIAARS